MSEVAIPSDELQDFEAVVRDYHRFPEEFKISSAEDIPAGLEPIRGVVTVMDCTSGVQRVYRTGHGQDWITSFAEELFGGGF